MVAPSPQELEKALQGDRASLGKCLSFMESLHPQDRTIQFEILRRLKLPEEYFILGITGPPGAGKSTLIETLGKYILSREPHTRLGVLTVDPSSTRSGGSLLGDKTRMPFLTASPRAFVRPLSSRGSLGGLHPRTREVLHLLSAAGYNPIFLETVGVGQSEIQVRHVCDFLLGVTLPWAGDEIQGLKRGIMEVVDALVINKADLIPPAKQLAYEQSLTFALEILGQTSEGINPFVLSISALESKGVPQLWEKLSTWRETHKSYIHQRRTLQTQQAFEQILKEIVWEKWIASHPLNQNISHWQTKLKENTSLWEVIHEIYPLL
ncbi:MAG: methylmalonyl Co-A mutase-associated GTPase MeaB [Bacteroidia bacterium]